MNLYRALRQATIIKHLRGQEPFHWVKARPAIQEFGSKYGRWGIDTSKLSPSTVVVTFGLGDDVTFERELIERYGCQVHGSDPTPNSVAFIRKTMQHPNFHAHTVALMDHDGTVSFALPPDAESVAVSASAVAGYVQTNEEVFAVPCLTLLSARTAFDVPKIDVLKMDIEGAEYQVIAQAVAQGWLADVSQVLVEFHHFLPTMSVQQTEDAVASLRSIGFDIAWIGRTNHEYLFTRSVAAN
jgi:FkbM family methyltransferase